MNTDALFRELEPPPGGTDRFARRLDQLAAARLAPRVRWLAVAAAVAAVALVTAIVALRTPRDVPPESVAATPPAVDIYNAPEFDRLLGRSPQPTELTVVLNEEVVAVRPIATTNQKVRIYEIN
jgi:hypothetical protein